MGAQRLHTAVPGPSCRRICGPLFTITIGFTTLNGGARPAQCLAHVEAFKGIDNITRRGLSAVMRLATFAPRCGPTNPTHQPTNPMLDTSLSRMVRGPARTPLPFGASSLLRHRDQRAVEAKRARRPPLLSRPWPSYGPGQGERVPERPPRHRALHHPAGRGGDQRGGRGGRRGDRGPSEKERRAGPGVGPTSAFYGCIPAAVHAPSFGPT